MLEEEIRKWNNVTCRSLVHYIVREKTTVVLGDTVVATGGEKGRG